MITPYWERDKCWGEVFHIFASDSAAVSYLNVNSGWMCSRHYHDVRANMFAVLSGSIVVEFWPEYSLGFVVPDAKSTMKVLSAGDSFPVGSCVWHRFRVIESGQLIEVYWADRPGIVRMDDITRFDVGGKYDLEELKREVAERGLSWPHVETEKHEANLRDMGQWEAMRGV